MIDIRRHAMYYDALRMRSEYLKESKEGAAHMCEIMEKALEQAAYLKML